ncbi:MAG TPA: phosphoribosyltransferase [Xanthomonadales bacterium]|nr:phosphoribosyltransferase [Xanthomonadales bacterium]
MNERVPDRYPLYDHQGLHALLDAMTQQIAARFDRMPLLLVGVLRRGVPLAEQLHARLARQHPDWSIERIDLKVKRYSDDLRLLHPETRLDLGAGQATLDLAGRRMLVVDDVLYQGHSLFRVVEFLRSRGGEFIHAAVLVDRCAARLPVTAEIVGARLQIAPADVIECNIPPYEANWQIDLYRPGASG